MTISSALQSDSSIGGPGFFDRLLDRSILFSFDRSGYRRHARRFRNADLDGDLHGRVCLVTGSNSGIGRAAATALAARGAEVWLLCRDRGRGDEAVRALRNETGNDEVHLAVVDVANLTSVRDFAAGFDRPRVDWVVHNAGVLPANREQTPDGLERTFATNVVGPFLLTHLLRTRLAASEDARVVFVSSGGMYGTALSLNDLDWSRRRFDGVAAYAQTKRMQIVLTELLARRWKPLGVSVHAMHPGWADTPAVRSSLPRFWRVMRNRLRTPEEGADTVVWLCIASEPKGASGRFWFDRAPAPTHLVPFTRETPEQREALHALCLRAAGITTAGEDSADCAAKTAHVPC